MDTPVNFKEWHFGVRAKDTGKLMAFISGTPRQIVCRKFAPIVCNVNFLCVHTKLRKKRLAPVLIKEMVRRMNLMDVWHAVYSSEEAFPMPFSQSQTFLRTLNPKKLVDTGFTSCPNTITI